MKTTDRLDYANASPKAFEAMLALENTVRTFGLEKSLLNIVKIRASEINRCIRCIKMHAEDAVERGETTERLDAISEWREADCFSERERAALDWTEALTRLSEGGVSDELFAATSQHFSEAELTNLTIAIIAINGWNRLNVGFGRD